MGQLVSRILTLFAFRSMRALLIVMAIILTVGFILPPILRPIYKQMTLGSRISTLSKLDAIDRSKMKEALLKESYSSLLAEISAKGENPAAVSAAPVKAIQTQKPPAKASPSPKATVAPKPSPAAKASPAPKASSPAAEKEKGPSLLAWLAIHLPKEKLLAFLAAAALFYIFGLACLFVKGTKVIARILALFLFLILGTLSGLALLFYIPLPVPLAILAAIPLSQALLLSFLGTLIRELNHG